jgi:hypothetical protein
LLGQLLICTWNAFSICCICICWIAFSVQHVDSANTLRSLLYAETWTDPGQGCTSKTKGTTEKWSKQSKLTGKMQRIEAKRKSVSIFFSVLSMCPASGEFTLLSEEMVPKLIQFNHLWNGNDNVCLAAS